jgi:hypothetical protein
MPEVRESFPKQLFIEISLSTDKDCVALGNVTTFTFRSVLCLSIQYTYLRSKSPCNTVHDQGKYYTCKMWPTIVCFDKLDVGLVVLPLSRHLYTIHGSKTNDYINT